MSNPGREVEGIPLANLFAVLDDVRSITQAIISNTDPNVLRVVNQCGITPISCLAVDAIGSGNPKVVESMFESGDGLSAETLMDLSIAVERSRRRGTDALSEFKSLIAKRV